MDREKSWWVTQHSMHNGIGHLWYILHSGSPSQQMTAKTASNEALSSSRPDRFLNFILLRYTSGVLVRASLEAGNRLTFPSPLQHVSWLR